MSASEPQGAKVSEELMKRIEALEARPTPIKEDQVLDLIEKQTLPTTERIELIALLVDKNSNEAHQKHCEQEINVAQLKVDLTKAFTDMNKELDTRHMMKIMDVEDDSKHRCEEAERHT